MLPGTLPPPRVGFDSLETVKGLTSLRLIYVYIYLVHVFRLGLARNFDNLPSSAFCLLP